MLVEHIDDGRDTGIVEKIQKIRILLFDNKSLQR